MTGSRSVRHLDQADPKGRPSRLIVLPRRLLLPSIASTPYWRLRGIVDVRRLDFGSVEGIFLGCVAAGVGVTLLPKGVVSAAWREGRVAVHELPLADLRVDTVFVRRRDGILSTRSPRSWTAPSASPPIPRPTERMRRTELSLYKMALIKQET